MMYHQSHGNTASSGSSGGQQQAMGMGSQQPPPPPPHPQQQGAAMHQQYVQHHQYQQYPTSGAAQPQPQQAGYMVGSSAGGPSAASGVPAQQYHSYGGNSHTSQNSTTTTGHGGGGGKHGRSRDANNNASANSINPFYQHRHFAQNDNTVFMGASPQLMRRGADTLKQYLSQAFQVNVDAVKVATYITDNGDTRARPYGFVTLSARSEAELLVSRCNDLDSSKGEKLEVEGFQVTFSWPTPSRAGNSAGSPANASDGSPSDTTMERSSSFNAGGVSDVTSNGSASVASGGGTGYPQQRHPRRQGSNRQHQQQQQQQAPQQASIIGTINPNASISSLTAGNSVHSIASASTTSSVPSTHRHHPYGQPSSLTATPQPQDTTKEHRGGSGGKSSSSGRIGGHPAMPGQQQHGHTTTDEYSTQQQVHQAGYVTAGSALYGQSTQAPQAPPYSGSEQQGYASQQYGGSKTTTPNVAGYATTPQQPSASVYGEAPSGYQQPAASPTATIVPSTSAPSSSNVPTEWNAMANQQMVQGGTYYAQPQQNQAYTNGVDPSTISAARGTGVPDYTTATAGANGYNPTAPYSASPAGGYDSNSPYSLQQQQQPSSVSPQQSLPSATPTPPPPPPPKVESPQQAAPTQQPQQQSGHMIMNATTGKIASIYAAAAVEGVAVPSKNTANSPAVVVSPAPDIIYPHQTPLPKQGVPDPRTLIPSKILGTGPMWDRQLVNPVDGSPFHQHAQYHRDCFSVLSWNILCQKYIETHTSYCSRESLDLEGRRFPLIHKMLDNQRADVLLLQEVADEEWFLLKPVLASLGYAAVWQPKFTYGQYTPDGIVTAFRTEVFATHSEFPTPLAVRLRKDQAQVGLAIYLVHQTTGKEIIVANTHLLGAKLEDDKRMFQTSQFLDVVRTFYFGDDGGAYLRTHNVGFVFGGDFNSLPRHGLCEALTNDPNQQDAAGKTHNAAGAKWCGGPLAEPYSANPLTTFVDKQYSCFMPFAQDQLDYCFYSPSALLPEAVLRVPSSKHVVMQHRQDVEAFNKMQGIDKSESNSDAGTPSGTAGGASTPLNGEGSSPSNTRKQLLTEMLPTPGYPSDHVPLMVVFRPLA